MNQINEQSIQIVLPSMEPEKISVSETRLLKRQVKDLLIKTGAVLVAHYYTSDEIQILAEETNGIVSDSLEMARFGHQSDSQIIVVAGVRFMGETAKILNPEKTILMPNLKADCSLDLGCPPEKFDAFCDQYPDRTVVVYANTSASVKARADWMVTSGSAVEVINHLKQKGEKILWAPDRFLGDYVREKTGADMVMWNGSCVVHAEFKARELRDLCRSKPLAKVIAHPESPRGVLEQADYVGSTTGLIDFVRRTEAEEFIVATDKGIFRKMAAVAPNKVLISAPTAGESATCQSCAECPWMAMNNLKELKGCLESLSPEIIVPEEIANKALVSIQRLLKFAQVDKREIYGNNDA